MKRLFAAVAAVALVVGAWFIWDARQSSDTASPTSDEPDTEPVDRPTVLCDPLAQDLCRGAGLGEVTVEEPGRTFQRVAAGKPLGATLWITSEGWSRMARQGDHALSGSQVVLGRSPLTVTLSRSGEAALDATCRGDWSCIGTRAADGSLRLGIDGAETSLGLATFDALVAAKLGRSDFASNDFTDTPDFETWFSQLGRSGAEYRPQGQSALDQQVTKVGSTDAATSISLRSSKVGATSITPKVTDQPSAVVLVAVGPLNETQRSALRSAAKKSGWEPGQPDGRLPSGGALVALYNLAKDATR